MKKFTAFLITALFISSSSIFAAGAFEPGSKTFSGGVSYVHLSGDAYFDTDILEITPTLTFCVSDGLFCGGIVQVRSISQDSYYGNTISDTQWQLGLTVERYFVEPSNSQIKLFPVVKTFLLYSKDEAVTQISFGGKVGFMKMVSEAVGLEFGIKGLVDRFSAGGNSISGFTMEASIGITSFIF